MADRRMFAKTIIDSDAFLDMPLSTQALYFHLAMRADDDGFVNGPKKIMRTIGASEGDAQILLQRRFILAFESGVIVIKHWRIHNWIRGDRKHSTVYSDEMAQLGIKPDGSYTDNIKPGCQLTDNCQTSDRQLTDKCHAEVRLGKDSIGKDSIGKDSIGKNNSAEPFRYELPLNDNTTFGVTESYISELKELYQAVDIDVEIRKMIGWCEGNPTKRKTKRGIRAFINSWLSRAQDSGGTKNNAEHRRDTGFKSVGNEI